MTAPPATFVFDGDDAADLVVVDTPLRPIGVGSFGAVFLVTFGGVRAALKIESRAGPAQIIGEVSTLRRLAGVVGVPRVLHGAASLGSCSRAFIMTLCGESLDKPLALAGGMFPLTTVTRVCEDVLRILSAVHARGIVHRDVKRESSSSAALPRGARFLPARPTYATQACHTGTPLTSPLLPTPRSRRGSAENICFSETLPESAEGGGFALVDFGLAAASDAPVVCGGRTPCVVGTARYASWAAHDGAPQLPIDDVQSLARVP